MKRFAYYAGSSPRWCLFWVAWSLGFGVYDWLYLEGAWRWLCALMLVLTGLQLYWAGWRAFSPQGRRNREWALAQRQRMDTFWTRFSPGKGSK